MTLTVIKGQRTSNSSVKSNRELVAALISCLGASCELELRLKHLVQDLPHSHSRARIHVLMAFCRAHMSRVRARLNDAGCKLSVMAGGVVIDEIIALPVQEQVMAFRRLASVTATRYEQKADLARLHSDLSTAWVFELNKVETRDMANEIVALFKIHE